MQLTRVKIQTADHNQLVNQKFISSRVVQTTSPISSDTQSSSSKVTISTASPCVGGLKSLKREDYCSDVTGDSKHRCRLKPASELLRSFVWVRFQTILAT